MRTFILPMIISFVLAGIGCATTSVRRTEESAPAWTKIASCTKDGNRISVVGSFPGVRNIALARMAAANRARAALVRCATASEEHVVQDGDTIVRTSYTTGTVTGATVDEYYVDPSSGTMYALASVPVSGISPAVATFAATE